MSERRRAREPEGDRDRRGGGGGGMSSNRANEYFIARDGIDREVITADICRYLGNDALVRPGTYADPQTGRRQDGYFITAYRNLTSAMIQDLKADSARWEAERQAALSGRDGYTSSQVHQSRQYYGPTEPLPAVGAGYAAAVTSPGVGQSSYADSYASSQTPVYGGTTGGFAQPPTYMSSQDNTAYVYGADLGVADSSRNARIPVSQPGPGMIPRNPDFTSTPTTHSYMPDGRSYQYNSTQQQQQQQQQQGATTAGSRPFPAQPQTDTFYGRDPQPPYDGNQIYDSSRVFTPQDRDNSYDPPPAQGPTQSAIPNTSSRRADREQREVERDRRQRRH